MKYKESETAFANLPAFRLDFYASELLKNNTYSIY